MSKLLSEMKRLERRVVAITYKDYIKLHPNSKKTPQDPMFSQPQQSTPQQSTPQQSNPQQVSRSESSPSMEPQVISKPYEFNVEVKQGGQTVGSANVMHGLDAMESFDYYDEEKHPFVKEILEPLSESEQYISKISEINVDPRFRGKGIARSIMNTTLKNLKEKHPDAPVFLCAYPSDVSGQNIHLEDLVNFYKSFGFEELGRHQWENGTVEAIMWLSSPSKAKTASSGRLVLALLEIESKLQAIVASKSKVVDSIKLVLSAYSSDDPIQNPDPLSDDAQKFWVSRWQQKSRL